MTAAVSVTGEPVSAPETSVSLRFKQADGFLARKKSIK